MFDNAIQQAIATKDSAINAIVKLAKVTSVSGGRAYVQHYGDSAASTKQYTYIDGYFPAVDDVVAMLPQGNTWIIIGKVCDTTPTEKYATKTYVDDTFLTTDYKNKIESSNNSVTLSNADLIPSANNAVSLGTSSALFKNAYIQRMIGSLSNTASANTIGWISNTVFAPSTSNSIELGSSSLLFKEIFSTKFTGDLDGKILDGSYTLSWDNNHNLIPSTSNYLSLGTSLRQYKNIYGQNLYVNGTAVSSDRRIKKDIKQLDERYEKFFSLLNPSGFKYTEGESGRTHTGFIAQEVEEAAKEAGLNEEDLAVVVIDSEGRYYLRYEELVAVQAQVIQKMQRKVDNLEARIAKLEALLERSMDK